MKAGWLSKYFGINAGAIGALFAATAATAATVYAVLPYNAEDIVQSAPEVPPTYKPKSVPKAPAPVAEVAPNLFVHISPTDRAPFFDYMNFCKEYAGKCGSQGNMTAVLLNDDTLKLLSSVNVGVNKAVHFKADEELYGTGKFAIPVSRNGEPPEGDCDDYTLIKMDVLRRHGIPQETMMMGLVSEKHDPNFTHAILIVRTTGGDYVLDNRHEEVKLARDTEYKFWFAAELGENPVISKVVHADDKRETALLNLSGLRVFHVAGDKIPSAEDVHLALVPPVPGEEIIVLAQTPQPTAVSSVAAAPMSAPAAPALR